MATAATAALCSATGLTGQALALPCVPFVHKTLRGPVIGRLLFIGVDAKKSEDAAEGEEKKVAEDEVVDAGGGLSWLEYGEAHYELSMREEKNALFVAARLLLYVVITLPCICIYILTSSAEKLYDRGS